VEQLGERRVEGEIASECTATVPRPCLKTVVAGEATTHAGALEEHLYRSCESIQQERGANKCAHRRHLLADGQGNYSAVGLGHGERGAADFQGVAGRGVISRAAACWNARGEGKAVALACGRDR